MKRIVGLSALFVSLITLVAVLGGLFGLFGPKSSKYVGLDGFDYLIF